MCIYCSENSPSYAGPVDGRNNRRYRPESPLMGRIILSKRVSMMYVTESPLRRFVMLRSISPIFCEKEIQTVEVVESRYAKIGISCVPRCVLPLTTVSSNIRIGIKSLSSLEADKDMPVARHKDVSRSTKCFISFALIFDCKVTMQLYPIGSNSVLTSRILSS